MAHCLRNRSRQRAISAPRTSATSRLLDLLNMAASSLRSRSVQPARSSHQSCSSSVDIDSQGRRTSGVPPCRRSSLNSSSGRSRAKSTCKVWITITPKSILGIWSCSSLSFRFDCYLSGPLTSIGFNCRICPEVYQAVAAASAELGQDMVIIYTFPLRSHQWHNLTFQALGSLRPVQHSHAMSFSRISSAARVTLTRMYNYGSHSSTCSSPILVPERRAHINTRLYEFSLTLLSVANATQMETDGRRPQINPRVVQSGSRAHRLLPTQHDHPAESYRNSGGSGSSSSDLATQDISKQASPARRQPVHTPRALELDIVPLTASGNDSCCSAEPAAFMKRLEREGAPNGTDLLS